MNDNTSIKRIVILTSQKHLAVSLMRAVGKVGQGCACALIQNLEEWKNLPAGQLYWAIVDAEALPDPDSATAFLNNFSVCILHNVKRNPVVAQAAMNATKLRNPATIFHVEAFFIAAEVFLEKYAPQFSLRLGIPAGFEIKRRKAFSRHPENDNPKVIIHQDSKLIDLISYLQSSLYPDPNRLEKEFVSETSKTEIPELQRALDCPPLNIDEAKNYLTSHCVKAASPNPGMFVLGKSGTGKSTLAHYFARELARGNSALAICIDYTLVGTREIYKANVIPLLREVERALPEIEKVASIGAKNTVFTLPVDDLSLLVTNKYRDGYFNQLSDGVSLILLSESDPSFITRMFCFWEQNGKSVYEVFHEFGNQSAMIDLATKWYASLRNDLPQLFVKYLLFAYRVSFQSVEEFSFREILRYTIELARSLPLVWDCLASASKEGQLSAGLVRAIQARDANGFLIEAFTISPGNLRFLTLNLLKKISEIRKLSIFLDNLDQRPNRELEALSVKTAISFFRHDIQAALPATRAVVFMRGTTFCQHTWIMADTMGWNRIELGAPHFVGVLAGRCLELRRSSLFAELRNSSAVRDVMLLVEHWRRLGGEAESKKPFPKQTLLDIILARHPYNVRQQLSRFGECCKNVALHRFPADVLLSANSPGGSPIRKLSTEFYLRVFLLGESEWYRESYDKVMNIYDAGMPNAKFNALLRGGVLRWLRYGQEYSESDFEAFLSKVGVRGEGVSLLMDDFLKSNLLLRSPKTNSRYLLSNWGAYFRDYVAFDIPYIDIIWWDTSMPEEFDLGPVRRLLPSEIRSSAERFIEWLRFEEELFKRSVEDSAERKFFIIAELVQENIEWSLRKIEQKLPEKASGNSEFDQ